MATKGKAAPASNNSSAVARTQANRKRRLLRTQKQQPNNTQVEKALLDDKAPRKAPKTSQWSHSMIYLAKLYKEFGCPAPKELFSNNLKVQQAALLAYNNRSKREFNNLPQGRVDFSLAARVNIRQGG